MSFVWLDTLTSMTIVNLLLMCSVAALLLKNEIAHRNRDDNFFKNVDKISANTRCMSVLSLEYIMTTCIKGVFKICQIKSKINFPLK